MDPNKPTRKPAQRSRKADQRSQKPDQPNSPKPDRPDADNQISATTPSTDASASGAIESADVPSNGVLVPVDPPGAVVPAAVVPAYAFAVRAGAPADNPAISIATIASAYGDYTRKSFQEGASFIDKLMGVRSLDKAIEIQTDFARQAYENFVAESQKICELYSQLASQILKPWEGAVAKLTQAAR
jgi:hypothetical protein